MDIRLKSLTLLNFKGVRNQHIEFDATETTLLGENGTGKTTVFDAFWWLFFGKDSTGRKDFEIKTLDSNNKVIPNLDHEVQAEIIVDGQMIVPKKVYKEKWVKKKGAEVAEFTGHETAYFWNEVPMSQKEFQQKIDGIFNESIFKLITSPTAFNELKWQERRAVLVELAGGIDTMAILRSIEGSAPVVLAIEQDGKSIDEFKKQIAAQIKKSKEELDAIPHRINEANRSKPEVPEGGFVKINVELAAKNSELMLVDDEITNKSKAFDDKAKLIQDKKLIGTELLDKKQTIDRDTKNAVLNVVSAGGADIAKMKGDLLSKKNTLTAYENTGKTLAKLAETVISDVVKTNTAMTEKRDAWSVENSREIKFNDADFCCPTCKRAFEETNTEARRKTMIDNFNTDKANNLAKISADGKKLATERDALEKEGIEIGVKAAENMKMVELLTTTIKELTDQITAEEAKITSAVPKASVEEQVQKMLAENVEYKKIVADIAAIRAEIDQMTTALGTAPDTTELKTKRAAVVAEIDAIKSELFKEQQIVKVDERVKQLEAEEKTLSATILENERLQFIIDKFNKLKVQFIEDTVNDKFKLVNFKMFEQQINGGEAETCICTINGVPYLDANTASKVNAGVDIINALCEHYNVTAPVFVDNRESVINLIACASQIINLFAFKGEKVLRIA